MLSLVLLELRPGRGRERGPGPAGPAVPDLCEGAATRTFVKRSDSCRVRWTRLLPRASRFKTFCTSAARDASDAHRAARLPIEGGRRQKKTNANDRQARCDRRLSVWFRCAFQGNTPSPPSECRWLASWPGKGVDGGRRAHTHTDTRTTDTHLATHTGGGGSGGGRMENSSDNNKKKWKDLVTPSEHAPVPRPRGAWRLEAAGEREMGMGRGDSGCCPLLLLLLLLLLLCSCPGKQGQETGRQAGRHIHMCVSLVLRTGPKHELRGHSLPPLLLRAPSAAWGKEPERHLHGRYISTCTVRAPSLSPYAAHLSVRTPPAAPAHPSQPQHLHG